MIEHSFLLARLMDCKESAIFRALAESGVLECVGKYARVPSLVLISDGNLEKVPHAGRKIGLFGKKNPI